MQCFPARARTNLGGVGHRHPSHDLGKHTMIRVGVVGYGYWGPNIVRNLRSLEG